MDDCLLNKVNIDDYPMYAIDYIFLKIRAKSIGEVVEAEYKCNNIITEDQVDSEGNKIGETSVPCDNHFRVQFNLDSAFVKFPENFNQKCIIELSDTIGIRLKSPSFSKFRSVGLEGKGIIDITDEYVYSCVDAIYEGDKVLLPGVDFTLEELKEFIDSFPSDKINQVSEFFKNQPTVSMLLDIKCPKCQNKSTVELSGLKDFFD